MTLKLEMPELFARTPNIAVQQGYPVSVEHPHRDPEIFYTMKEPK